MTLREGLNKKLGKSMVFCQLQCSFRCLNMYFFLSENSLKAASPKALHESSESRLTFVESSPKAGWLSLNALQKAEWFSLSVLRKQDDFRWELYESRMTFVKSSTKAFKKGVNCNKTMFCDKIAYFGGPSFRRRSWHFSERRSHNICHPGQVTSQSTTWFE